jgi:hypothetical protein
VRAPSVLHPIERRHLKSQGSIFWRRDGAPIRYAVSRACRVDEPNRYGNGSTSIRLDLMVPVSEPRGPPLGSMTST